MPNKRGAISEKVLKSFKKQQRSLRSSIQKRWQYYSNKNKTNHGKIMRNNFLIRFC